MRLSRLLIVAIIIFSLVAGIAGASFASAQDDLNKAAKLVAKAEAAKSTADKNDYYKQALDAYREVADSKRYAGTPEGAQAMYQIAYIQKEATAKKVGDLYGSYNTLKTLLGRYDKSVETLVEQENLTRAEAQQVRAVVADAKELKTDVAAALNEKNSQSTLYKVMDFFVKLTGSRPGFSYWLAVVIVTVLVKILITPLTKAQFKAMKEMQKVAPLIKEIQEKYKGDQRVIGEKTMELYKEHKINPFASCLPLLVQMPVLILLYHMIKSYEFEFVKGSFLWIGSGLSHLFGFVPPISIGIKETLYFTAANLAEPDLLLLVLYLVSMYVSTRLSAVDPTQAEQQKMMSIMMPLMFAFIFAGFPSAFLLYWLIFNILQTAQQYMILRSGREEALALAGASSGKVVPETPSQKPSEGGEKSDRQSQSQRARRRRRR